MKSIINLIYIFIVEEMEQDMESNEEYSSDSLEIVYDDNDNLPETTILSDIERSEDTSEECDPTIPFEPLHYSFSDSGSSIPDTMSCDSDYEVTLILILFLDVEINYY
jgi:hypothetical protein